MANYQDQNDVLADARDYEERRSFCQCEPRFTCGYCLDKAVVRNRREAVYTNGILEDSLSDFHALENEKEEHRATCDAEQHLLIHQDVKQRETDYGTDLAEQVENLIDWIIDRRGWSRLNCTGEALTAIRHRYETLSRNVNQPS